MAKVYASSCSRDIVGQHTHTLPTTVVKASVAQSPLFHTSDFGTVATRKTVDSYDGSSCYTYSSFIIYQHSFTSLLDSFSLFSLDLRLDPLGLIWLAALAKKALLTSHSGSCGTVRHCVQSCVIQACEHAGFCIKHTLHQLIQCLKLQMWQLIMIFSTGVKKCILLTTDG